MINSFSEGETLEAAAEACRAAGSPQVIAIAGDVSKKDQVDAMIKKTVEEMGSLDILVNNAGGTPSRPPTILVAHFSTPVALYKHSCDGFPRH